MKNNSSANSGIDVSIVIVAYKNAALLKLCLDALSKNISSSISFEIIVVDSEACEEVRDLVLDCYPQVMYLPFRENIGFAKGLNEGLRHANGKALLSLNPDIIIQPGSVEALYRYAMDHPEAGIIGPMLLNFNGSRQASCFAFYTPFTILYRRTFLGKTFPGKRALKNFIIATKETGPQKIVGWLMGSALMVGADNLKRVGMMDERYFMYFEDVDWCRRFHEAGFDVVYYPEAKMFHYHGKQSASKNIFSIFFNKITFIHLLSGFKYFVKFKGWRVV